ncbi:hypothetical protein QI050_11805 [Staphylococcus saprophyticus]|nr:hypothetical protein [Staphylococcus saprophyticus]MDW4426301.1 hypothetical protein [Staphylococcus saprophyticus]
MAYEYEDKINEAFFKAGRDGRNVNRELLAELQEVYCKAKAWEQFKNDYHTEITQAIDNLFKLNNMDIAGETIFLLEKILNDMEDE